MQPAGGKGVARAVYGLVLLMLVAVAWWALSETAPPEPAPSIATVPVTPPPAAERRDLERDAPPPPLEVQTGTPFEPSTTTPRTPGPSVLTPRPPKHLLDPDGLARESALLARARGEVTSEPESALKTLAERHQAFPAGAFEQEAELVHVEALLRLGRRQEAESLGRKLMARDQRVSRTVERLLASVTSN